MMMTTMTILRRRLFQFFVLGVTDWPLSLVLFVVVEGDQLPDCYQKHFRSYYYYLKRPSQIVSSWLILLLTLQVVLVVKLWSYPRHHHLRKEARRTFPLPFAAHFGWLIELRYPNQCRCRCCCLLLVPVGPIRLQSLLRLQALWTVQ